MSSTPPEAATIAAFTGAKFAPGTEFRRIVLGVLALLALTLAAYWPLHTAGFIWDDTTWLVKNHFAHHWRGLWNIWFNPHDSIQYYPMVYTFFMVQWHLWGAHALGYHLVNIVVQGVNAILLWRVLAALNLRSAWIAAAIWAIHPVQVETVGWVVEQKSLLSALFLFLALLAWCEFSNVRGGRPTDQPRLSRREWYLYVLGSFTYILALFSKTDACMIPVVLLFVLWWKRGRINSRDVLLLIPWMILGCLAALMTIHIEHGQAGANGAEFKFTLAQHFIIAGKDLWFYPFKLFWPWPMLEVYPRWSIHHLAMWEWIFPITAAAVPLALLAWAKKIGRGPLVAVCIYGMLISPLLGFIAFTSEAYTFVADHYQYLACIGIIILVTEFIAGLLAQSSASVNNVVAPAPKAPIESGPGSTPWSRVNWAGICLAGLTLTALGGMTWAQCEIYTPPNRIWTHDLKYYPKSWMAMQAIGVYDFTHGNQTAGLPMLLAANRLAKGHGMLVSADLGDAYRSLKQYHHAILYYRRSLMLASDQPFIIAHLVQCYTYVGNWTQAYDDVARGIHLYPRSAVLQNELAQILAKAGYAKRAIPHYLLAIKYARRNEASILALAKLLDSTGQWNKASFYYQRLITSFPTYIRGHFSYGVALLRHGQADGAVQEFRTVLQLARQARARKHTLGKNGPPEPWRIETHRQLALALQATRHPRQAARQDAIAAALEQRSEH